MAQLTFPDYDIERARRYGRIRRLGAIGQTGTSLLRGAAMITTGHAQRTRDRIGRLIRTPAIADAAHIVVLSAETWALGLPERYLLHQRLEQQWGMTKRSDRGWFREEVLSLGVQAALTAPMGAAALAVVRRSPDRWHVILSSVAVPVQVVLMQLAPVLIFPIFNSFDPVEDEMLAGRIQELADRAGVPLNGIFIADMSRQSEKANAFFTGIGATKRVVLGDTLLRNFKADEVDGVVAHELGHQVHGDIWRMSAANAVAGFAGAVVLKELLPIAAAKTARWTGTSSFNTSGSLPLWGVVSGLFGAVASPLFMAMSRAIERRTDAFAVQLTEDGAAYARGMERLMRQNLDDPYPPAWSTKLFRSHPPTGERIEAALRAAGARQRLNSDRPGWPVTFGPPF
jgi:STE24 endopeptidase